MVELAGRRDGERLSARRLGEALDIPYPFARRIVTQLATAGFVDTQRGVGGGVSLARPAADISLRDIVCRLDGPISLNGCTRTPGFCSRSPECPVHGAWLEADAVLDRFLGAKDLASMGAAANGRRPTAGDAGEGAAGRQTEPVGPAGYEPHRLRTQRQTGGASEA